MKLLVCAASKYGATSEIARAVAGVLAERGCEVTVLSPDRVGAVEEFDAVVLGRRGLHGPLDEACAANW